MDFFLEIHNGECGLGGHFVIIKGITIEIIPLLTNTSSAGRSSGNGFDTGRSQKSEVRQKSDRIHDEEINKGESTLLIMKT